jgi:hypothetical protein
MAIVHQRFEGDKEGDAAADKAKATSGPKESRLEELYDSEKATKLASYDAAVKQELAVELAIQVIAQEASE